MGSDQFRYFAEGQPLSVRQCRATLPVANGGVRTSPGLDSAALPEALRMAAVQYVPGVRLLVTGDPRPVPADIRHALLRVMQSAAANIQLHAAASNATVTVGYLPGSDTLEVFDDGAGFNPQSLAPPSDAGGYGLRAMRQRVERLGGVFSVESGVGGGTIVAAQLPTAETA